MRVNFIAASLVPQHGQGRALQRRKMMVAANAVHRLKDFVFEGLRREHRHAVDEIFGHIQMAIIGTGDADPHGVVFAAQDIGAMSSGVHEFHVRIFHRTRVSHVLGHRIEAGPSPRHPRIQTGLARHLVGEPLAFGHCLGVLARRFYQMFIEQ